MMSWVHKLLSNIEVSAVIFKHIRSEWPLMLSNIDVSAMIFKHISDWPSILPKLTKNIFKNSLTNVLCKISKIFQIQLLSLRAAKRSTFQRMRRLEKGT